WEYDKAVVDEVNTLSTNQRYLEGLSLSRKVVATTDMQAFFREVDIVFVTLPSRFVKRVIAPHASQVSGQLPFVNMSKGIEEETGETVFQQLSALFPHNPLAMVAGPSLANEFSRGVFTAVVAASEHIWLVEKVRQLMSNLRFAVVASEDAIGVELGGILKNIYALGMGLFDQRTDKGMNLVGAYLTQSLKEMTLLGVAMGASPGSFTNLSGVGDLITTAMSEHSHNQKMGRLVASQMPIESIRKEMGVLPEGYNTVRVALKQAARLQLDLPLASLIYRAVNDNLGVDDFLDEFSGILA
ncbi:MAG: hypothetical protein KDI30_06700, partial [Pseudomonadales bacterium]|nr:hypothetical protein [Pseudomonadales bacterium]